MSEKEVTLGQMSEFWRQVGIDQINRSYFQDFLDHKLVKSSQESALLGPAEDIITIPNRSENFHVQKTFAKYRGNNFDKWFVGKVEEPKVGGVLQDRTLLRKSTDPGIIAELGGSFAARITLADINHARESGALRKDCFHIGYVEDDIRFKEDEPFSYVNEKGQKCVLRAVLFGWGGDGWRAVARSIDALVGWIAGYQVLSRNSKSLESQD